MSGVLGFGLYNNLTPCLRIAYDPATDLATEDPANRGKFMLDTVLGTSISYFYEIIPYGYDSRYRTGGWGPNNIWFFNNHDVGFNSPYTGSNIYTTCGAYIYWNTAGTGAQTIYFYEQFWGFGWQPIFEYRRIDPSLGTNTFKGAVVDYTAYQNSGAGFVVSTAGFNSETSNEDVAMAGTNYDLLRRGYNVPLKTSNPNQTFNFIYSVWQVPAMDDAMPNFADTPVSGQQVLLLNPTTARLALPGRTVADSNPDHYIFHEDKIPAKVMKAGDVAIAGNATVYINCPLPLTALTYMDFMIKRTTDAEFWNPPYYDSISSDKSLAFNYTIDLVNNRVVVVNGTATAITLRYLILADSNDAPTTGGKKVLYKGNDGTTDFVQIKRPGSSDVAPNLNDIIVDSRLAYLPILAQGYLNWPGDFPTSISSPNLFRGEKMATINISNPSPKLKLFVKQNVVFDHRAEVGSRANFHKVMTSVGATWTGRATQDSSWANIRSTEDAIDFYMAGANPIGVDLGGTHYNRRPTSGGGTDTVALGLNYLVFGIPDSL